MSLNLLFCFVLSRDMQNGGHNVELPTSAGFRDSRLRRWRHRRRTVSLTEGTGEAHSLRVSVYLSPVDILTYLQRPFRRLVHNTASSTDPAASAAVSLPDVRVENGSLHFKCWAPSSLVGFSSEFSNFVNSGACLK